MLTLQGATAGIMRARRDINGSRARQRTHVVQAVREEAPLLGVGVEGGALQGGEEHAADHARHVAQEKLEHRAQRCRLLQVATRSRSIAGNARSRKPGPTARRYGARHGDAAEQRLHITLAAGKIVAYLAAEADADEDCLRRQHASHVRADGLPDMDIAYMLHVSAELQVPHGKRKNGCGGRQHGRPGRFSVRNSTWVVSQTLKAR